MRKPVMSYASIKDVDQPAHPRSLVSILVYCPGSMIPKMSSNSNPKKLQPDTVTEQANLSVARSHYPENRPSHEVSHLALYT